MKNLLLLLTLFISNSHGKDQIIRDFLTNSIKNGSKECWESSVEGGYIFETQVDLIGDNTPEKLVKLTINGIDGFHIFSGEEDSKYLGKISWGLLHQPKVKTDGVTTIISIYEGGNYPNGKEEPFTNKVLSTKISSHGITVDEKIVGSRAGEVSEKEFQVIRKELAETKNRSIAPPLIKYIRVKDFLDGTREWKKYKKEEWRLNNGYYTPSKEWTTHQGYPVLKSWYVANVEKKKLDQFTEKEALNLLSKPAPKHKNTNDPEKESPEEFSPRIKSEESKIQQKIKSDETKQTDVHNYFSWIIGGVCFVGILLFSVRNSQQRK